MTVPWPLYTKNWADDMNVRADAAFTTPRRIISRLSFIICHHHPSQMQITKPRQTPRLPHAAPLTSHRMLVNYKKKSVQNKKMSNSQMLSWEGVCIRKNSRKPEMRKSLGNQTWAGKTSKRKSVDRDATQAEAEGNYRVKGSYATSLRLKDCDDR